MTEEEQSWRERRKQATGEINCFSISEKDLAEIVVHLRQSEQQ